MIADYRVLEFSPNRFKAQRKTFLRWRTLGHVDFIDVWCFFEDVFDYEHQAWSRIHVDQEERSKPKFVPKVATEETPLDHDYIKALKSLNKEFPGG